MSTTVKSASIKVMRSFDYCHFEVAMSIESDNGITTQEIDNTRKECMRLTKTIVRFSRLPLIESCEYK